MDTTLTTSLCAWGASSAVRIPKKVCEETGIAVKSELTMDVGKDALGPFILIRPKQAAHRSYGDAPYRSIDELFAGYSGDYRPTECDWGADTGREVME